MSNDVSTTARRATYQRDGQSCAACGRRTQLTIQHRRNRQMGGSRERNNPANLLTLCHFHNDALESDPEFATLGRARGWKLEEGDDPTTSPVFYSWAGQWRMLDDDYHWVIV